MMFNMREFVKSGFLKAVGNMPDFWIILNAAGWNEKGVLTEKHTYVTFASGEADNA